MGEQFTWGDVSNNLLFRRHNSGAVLMCHVGTEILSYSAKTPANSNGGRIFGDKVR